MVPIAPLYLWLVLQGGFLHHKLDKIFHYKGNNLIFYRNFKGIALILMFKLSYFVYIKG